ncbi:MAG: RNase adapter RapZ [Myxococcales bacterium]
MNECGPPSESSRLLVFVTGLSGAGRSTAVAALEDLGFFCVDNLPGPVVKATLETLAEHGVSRTALGLDVRVGAFFDQAADVVDSVCDVPNLKVEVLFLDASDETLLRRFSSTRRPHPLSMRGAPWPQVEAPAVLDGIRFERNRLASLRDRSTTIIDTTSMTVHELRRRIVELYGPGAGGRRRMRIRMVSFGFKYGSPIDADLVFDARFLKNPYFVDELRAKTGQDSAVSAYVLDNDDGRAYLALVESFLEFCIPRFENEGRSYLTVAVGCTGGQHRSVALVETIANHLRARGSGSLHVLHRDAERNRASERPAMPVAPELEIRSLP